MISIKRTNPSFMQASIISPPKIHKTQGDIFKEEIKEDARIAKNKPKEERNLNDYLAITIDTLNDIKDNIPVKHLDSGAQLDLNI